MKKILFGVMAMGMLTGTSFIAKGAVDTAEVNVLVRAIVGQPLAGSDLIITDTEFGTTQVSNPSILHAISGPGSTENLEKTLKLYAKRANGGILTGITIGDNSLVLFDNMRITMDTTAQMSGDENSEQKINYQAILQVDGKDPIVKTTSGIRETLGIDTSINDKNSVGITITSKIASENVLQDHVGKSFSETNKLVVTLSKTPQL